MKNVDDILVRLAWMDPISQRDRATVRDAMQEITDAREHAASMKALASLWMDRAQDRNIEIARLTAERDEARRRLSERAMDDLARLDAETRHME